MQGSNGITGRTDYTGERLGVWASGGSQSTRVIKANTHLLNYSERRAAQCLCHQLNVTHSHQHAGARTPTWLICHVRCVRSAQRCLSGALMLQQDGSPAVPGEEPYCLQSYCICHLQGRITELSTPSYSRRRTLSTAYSTATQAACL